MVIGDSDLMIWDSNIMWKMAKNKKNWYVIIYQEYVREAPAALPPPSTHLLSSTSKVVLLNTKFCSFNCNDIVTHFKLLKVVLYLAGILPHLNLKQNYQSLC